MTILDSKQYKEIELQSWNSAAAGWQKWWKTIERGTEKVSKQLIALAEIKSDSRILDIATGIGEPAITAANQIGNSGHILAIDISPQMLSIAKQRAISLGLQNVIEFKDGGIETIDSGILAAELVLLIKFQVIICVIVLKEYMFDQGRATYLNQGQILGSAVENEEGSLDKAGTSHDDSFDALRLSLMFWH